MADTQLAQRPTAPPSNLRPRFSWLTDRWLAVSFITPTLAILLFISIFPLVWSLYLSFTDWSVIRDAAVDPSTQWVGTANYVDLLTDRRTWERFIVTGQFVVPAVTLELLIGFGVAMLLNRRFTGRGLIMTLMLVPMMLSPVVVALFWRFMMQGEGVLNYYVVNLLQQPPVLWLTDRNIVIWSLVLVDVWMWTPFMMLMSLAGLSAVPRYLYEAAAVDRAGAWFRFRHITLPMVTPLLLIAIIFRTMDAYKLFDQAFVLLGNRGGPGRAGQTAALWVYEEAFTNWNTGSASALGYIMLIVIIALANLFIRALNATKGAE
ncbi:MAG: ABC transporter permease [Anaerolineaceae bacterium]|nr:ABC transporter permease [Anaerolineaceae bacterium]